MLDAIRRLFVKPPSEPAPDLAQIAAWARQRGLRYKRARDSVGFIVDGKLDDQPWRMEWGPPQRHYIDGYELRLRMEMSLPSDLQMLVLSRRLMELLERQTYESFTEDTQTQIDTSTPEEMRWLVMYTKVNLSSIKRQRSHYAAVSSLPETALAWIDGPLAQALEQAGEGLLTAERPFVLMTLRGNAYLRLQMPEIDAALVAGALTLFEAAVRQLRVLPPRDAATRSQPAETAWQSLPDPAPRPPN